MIQTWRQVIVLTVYLSLIHSSSQTVTAEKGSELFVVSCFST